MRAPITRSRSRRRMTATWRRRAASSRARASCGRTATRSWWRGWRSIRSRIGRDLPEESVMKGMSRFVCALAVASLASAGQSSKVDVTGKWLFNVQTDAGSGTPTVTLKQEGEKLTGHYSSQNFGEQELTGTVKGNE